jgi:asparagine synthase (glutamine-hydrolysing)
MGAVFGLINIDGRPAGDADMVAMVNALKHRGTDGTAYWAGGKAGLGHARLCNTPESLSEKLPLVKAEGRLVITADARLDNRHDLCAELLSSGRPQQEVGDGELILLAYERWGRRCVEHLGGDFAFAIWDSEQNHLFGARDHFGVKPFCYFKSSELFAFSTEIKGLLALRNVPRRLNEEKLGDFLSELDEDKESTFYRDILRLPPACSISVDRNGVQVSPYWELDPVREVRLKSDQEYAEAFRDLFTKAVRCRLRSAFPVASMLSGGLDSSSVTCVARDLLNQTKGGRLVTFSAVFHTAWQSDESHYVRSVVAQNSIQPNYVVADELSPMYDFDRLLEHQDQPIPSGNLYINWGIYERAQQLGIRTILDGFDGDTTVSHGTGYLMELARAGKWLTLTREARGYAKHFDNCPPWALVWRNLEKYGLSPGQRKLVRPAQRGFRAVRYRAGRLFSKAEEVRPPSTFIRNEFVQRAGLEERRKRLRRGAVKGIPGTERAIHHRKLTWSLMATVLESLDIASGVFGIENRFPFWDKSLVEFCLALPASQKLSGGWNRMVMRRALEGVLPTEVQWRGGKSDMSHAFNHSLLAYDRDRLSAVMSKDITLLGEYINVEELKEVFDRSDGSYASGDVLRAAFKFASLALWLRHTGITV